MSTPSERSRKFQRHALRTEREGDLVDAAFHVQRVVDEAQIRSHEAVVALYAVQEERTLGVGAGSDGRTGPVDRGADERVVVGVGDDAVQFLGRDVRREAQQGEK